MKKTLCILLLVCLFMCTAMSAGFAAGYWLPDPGPVFGAEGQKDPRVFTNAKTGSSAHAYLYDFYADRDFAAKQSFVYLDKLNELGITFHEIEFENIYCAYNIEMGDEFTQFLMAPADLSDYVSLNEGKVVRMRITMIVPDSWDFTLGKGPSGLTSDGRYVCFACNGSKRCDICNGMGYWRYMGETFDCDACNETGVCAICNGTGKN